MSRFFKLPVLAPIDFSEEADRAVSLAIDLAGSATDVVVLHVTPSLVGFEPGFAWDVANDEERIERLREAFERRYSEERFRGLRFEVRFGDPGHEIAAYAKEVDAGLVVLPSHGRTGLAHLLIGSTSERVVRLAPCPVLVLRA